MSRTQAPAVARDFRQGPAASLDPAAIKPLPVGGAYVRSSMLSAFARISARTPSTGASDAAIAR
jgi:hypothetical protein